MAKGKTRQRDKRTTRNLHFREQKSVRYSKGLLTDEFRLFVENEIWPQLTELHKGYKLKDKQEITAQVAHKLIEAGLTEKVVSDSRDNSKNYLRLQTWDAFIAHKLCKVCIGSEESQRDSLYRATNYLLNLRKLWELALLEDLDLKRNTETTKPTSHALVVFYTGKADWLTGRTLPEEQQKVPQSILEFIKATCQRDKNDIRKPDPQAVENGLAYFREVENKINAINQENLRHSWMALRKEQGVSGNLIDTAFQPNVCLRQIHSGKLFRGTRLYSWSDVSGQSMSEEQRRTIKIDGQTAAEIDAQCYHPRLAYHNSGIDERGDCYWPEKIFNRFYSFKNVSGQKQKIVRDFLKVCTMIVFNTASRNSAIKAMAKAVRDDKHKNFLIKTIFNTEATDLNGIMERIISAHPEPVAAKFFTEYGMELMRIDGCIMFHLLDELVVNQHRPCLAIHDALVVKASDVSEAKEIFTKTYQKFTGFKPVLKREF